MSNTTDTTIEVYSKKHVDQLYAGATHGKRLSSSTLARLVKSGEVRKLVEPGRDKQRGMYVKEDVDRWIEQLKNFYSNVRVVA